MTPANPYETIGRQKKAHKLAAALHKAGCHSSQFPLPDGVWKQAVNVANVSHHGQAKPLTFKPPSDETKALTLEALRNLESLDDLAGENQQ